MSQRGKQLADGSAVDADRLWFSLESLGRRQVVSRAAGERAMRGENQQRSDEFAVLAGMQPSPRSTSMSGLATQPCHDLARQTAIARANNTNIAMDAHSFAVVGEEAEIEKRSSGVVDVQAPVVAASRLRSFTDLFAEDSHSHSSSPSRSRGDTQSRETLERERSGGGFEEASPSIAVCEMPKPGDGDSEGSDGSRSVSSTGSGLLLKFEYAAVDCLFRSF
jgi:hypothetical protein